MENIEEQLQETNPIAEALLHHSKKGQLDALSTTVARIKGDVKSIWENLRTSKAVTAKKWNDIVLLRAVE